jgi:hypothetical protein
MAWFLSRRTTATYYEGEIYALSPRSHRFYAAVALGFAAIFAAFAALGIPAVIPLAAFVLTAVFYATSFLRGFSDME